MTLIQTACLRLHEALELLEEHVDAWRPVPMRDRS